MHDVNKVMEMVSDVKGRTSAEGARKQVTEGVF
jgi:hypothetical protein